MRREIVDVTQFGGSSVGSGGQGDSAPVAVRLRPEDIAALVEALKTTQVAVGNNNAQALGDGASATVKVGATPDEIEGMLRGAGAAAQEKIEELATELNARREAVVGFLRTMGREEVPLGQLPATLALIAQRYNSMMERLAALESEDDEAQALINEARNTLMGASRLSDYDRTDELLSKAEEVQQRSLERVEELEREAHDAARVMRWSLARTREQRGQLELTQLNYLKAEEHFREAARFAASDDPTQELIYLFRAAVSLQTYGDERGDNKVLKRAIESYRKILFSKKNNPILWVSTANSLADALVTLGERECDSELLKESVVTLRAVLRKRKLPMASAQRAMTLNNLGNALRALGERENETELLEESVDAFRAALSKRDMISVWEWAATMNNLGITLRVLGERDGGTERLEHSVDVFRAALIVRKRETMPRECAVTMNNLGIALRRLGERDGEISTLKEARTAFEDAWGVYREAGINHHDEDFADRLKEIDELIAARGGSKE